MNNSSCILVCISGKSDCCDLIKAGNAIAKRNGIRLSVVVVLPQHACFSPDSETLNLLEAETRRVGAELNVFFDDQPAACVAEFARKSHAFGIVTGFPGKSSSHFLSRMHALVPDIPINMVRDNKVFHISDAVCAEKEAILENLLHT